MERELYAAKLSGISKDNLSKVDHEMPMNHVTVKDLQKLKNLAGPFRPPS